MHTHTIPTHLSGLIGGTPLLQLRAYAALHRLHANIIAKLEYFNPAGSVKDRAAKYMIEDAERSGKLRPGAAIIEPTSGNTGIGLASVAVPRGYRVILTMPETMSEERRKLLAAYGAELVLTEGAKGMAGAVEKARALANEIPGAFIPGQFTNPACVLAHRETTGPEIWRGTDGTVNIFVAGVGSGGTITGAGEYLKEMNPDVKIIAAEPFGSPLLSEGKSGPHGIQGIGANFVPEILNVKIINEVITVREAEAYGTMRELVKTEGILAGISSGAALWAARQMASRPGNAGKNIVVILPDGGERYLSAGVFEGYNN